MVDLFFSKAAGCRSEMLVNGLYQGLILIRNYNDELENNHII